MIVCLVYLRLYFGVDGSDESLASGVPLRYAMGDKPYVDDWSLAQGAYMLCAPLVSLYVHLRGGIDGLILFSRHLYFLASCLLALFVTRGMARWGAEKQLAAAAGMIVVCFIPYTIPALSYNTLSCMTFLLGALLGIEAREFGRARMGLLAGGCHALTVIAYPPLIIAIAPFAVYHAWISPTRKMHVLGLYVLGGVTTSLFLLGVYGITPAELNLFLGRFGAAKGGEAGPGWASFQLMTSQLGNYVLRPGTIGTFALMLAALWIERKAGWAASVLVFCSLVLLGFDSRAVRHGDVAQGYILVYALLAPLLAWRLRKMRPVRPWLLGIWIPSLFIALVMGWVSSNGIFAIGLGLGAAALVTALFMGLWLGEVSKGSRFGLSAAKLSAVVTLCSLILFLTTAFNDGKVSLLRARVSRGAYQGLFTLREKKDYFEELITDIEAASQGKKRIVIYPHLPAGYLVSGPAPEPFANGKSAPMDLSMLAWLIPKRREKRA